MALHHTDSRQRGFRSDEGGPIVIMLMFILVCVDRKTESAIETMDRLMERR